MRGGELVVGLMSGTSLDGIDAVLLHVRGSGTRTRFVQRAFVTVPYPAAVRAMLLRNSAPATSRVDEITRLNMLLAHLSARAVRSVARRARVALTEIALIGSHGQTIHHLPAGYRMAGHTIRATLQIGDPSALAALTGILTVGDFRVADMALGGEGAPLVPYFDWLAFRSPRAHRLLLNIGGIANITAVPAGCTAADVMAFDTGPGNMVVDGLMQRIYGRPYDRNGQVAARGSVRGELLAQLARHPFLRKRPPRSTGREEFGEEFQRALLDRARRMAREDVVATAAEFTAFCVHDAYRRFVAPQMTADELIVSGGGAHNRFMLEALRRHFTRTAVRTVDDLGMSSDAKEAICFAILAHETVAGRPANLPRVTGARAPAILGKICPAYRPVTG